MGSGIPNDEDVEPTVGTDWKLVTVGWPDSCVGAIVVDQQLSVVAITDALVKRAGYNTDTIIGGNALGLVHPNDRDRAHGAWERLGRREVQPGHQLFRVSGRRGYESFGIQMAKAPHDDDLAIIHLHEVSAELRASALSHDLSRAVRVLAGEWSLESVVAALQDMTDRQFAGVTICTTLFEEDGKSVVFSGNDFPQPLLAENQRAHFRSLPAHVTAARDDLRGGSKAGDEDVGRQDPSMQQRVVFPLEDQNSDLLGYLDFVRPWDGVPTIHERLVYRAVAEVVRAAAMWFHLNSALTRAADHDYLSGLLNRRGFAKRVQHGAHGGGAIVVLDLDDFSAVNNELGHRAGDIAIEAAARRLTATAPQNAVVARFGGDEFVCWLPGATIEDGRSLAADFQRSLAIGTCMNNRRVRLAASVGVVAVAESGDLEQGIRLADSAMYLAKAQGGNNVVSSGDFALTPGRTLFVGNI